MKLAHINRVNVVVRHSINFVPKMPQRRLESNFKGCPFFTLYKLAPNPAKVLEARKKGEKVLEPLYNPKEKKKW